MRLAQSDMMSYILLTFFVFIILIITIILIGSWFSIQAGEMHSTSQTQRMLALTKALSISPLLNIDDFKEGYMFSDSKLTAMSCEDMRKIFGKGWFMEIYIPGSSVECTEANYPECGIWRICGAKTNAVGYEIPVNIYRVVSNKIEIGVMKVGIYA